MPRHNRLKVSDLASTTSVIHLVIPRADISARENRLPLTGLQTFVTSTLVSDHRAQ